MNGLLRRLVKVLLSPAIVALACAVITFVVFLPALRNMFVAGWDDGPNLLYNPNFRGLGWTQLKWIWTNHLMEHYIPLTWMTFAFDYTVWKLNPVGYHLTSLVIHSANVALLFVLALGILRRALAGTLKSDQLSLLGGAAVAALFFGIHPLRVESVAWATERRDVLCGFFYLLALLAYLRAMTPQQNRSPKPKYYWLCFLCFVAAVLSKEMAVTLPAVLIILDVYPLRRLGSASGPWLGLAARHIWIEKIPFLAVSLADSVMTIYVAREHHITATLATVGWVRRISITVYGMAFYVLKTVAPIHLSPLYLLSPHKSNPWGWPFLMSLAFVLAFTVAALRWRHRFPGLMAVWIAFGVTLLPVSGIVQNGFQIAADRYTYLACLGWALLVGAAFSVCAGMLARSIALRALLVTAAVLILALLGWQARAQLSVWQDADTLWSRAVAVEPSAIAFTSQGAAFFDEGDVLGAMTCYRRAIALEPGYALAHNALAGALFELHRFDESIQEFSTAQKLMPNLAVAYNGMGNVLMMQGNVAAAISQYDRAIQIDPDYPGARKNLEAALELKRRRQPPAP